MPCSTAPKYRASTAGEAPGGSSPSRSASVSRSSNSRRLIARRPRRNVATSSSWAVTLAAAQITRQPAGCSGSE
ncbi:hypothetical protein [Kitasatospora sp. NA04385]|uniref:hypothetical protein n=1 Tax=Kitasatospora sp. NA04385 TaxID=2742135 RepID=UPI0034CE85C2